MSRKSARSVRINTNLRCLRIYPVANSKKTVEDLDTIGFKLTQNQAIDLARILLAVTQDWKEIDITGFRFKERQSDRTYPITVTSAS